MSKLAAFFSANSGPIVGASVFVAGTLATGAYLGVLSPQGGISSVLEQVAMPAEETPMAEVAVSGPKAVSVPKTEAVPSSEIGPEPENDIVAAPLRAPTIDEVRSEADGLTILAGRGEPGSKVTLFVDNVENTTVQVGSDGAFAIIAFLEATTDPKVLSVVQRAGDIELVAADIILAPQVVAPTPVVVADNSDAVPIAKAPDETVVSELTPTTEIASDPEQVAITEQAAAKPQAAEPVEQVVVSASAPKDTAIQDPIAPEQLTIAPEPVTEVAILKSDETGVQIINRSSAPSVMSNVEIDTISYSEQGDVLLSGRAQAEATSVRVYLDNAVIASLEVDTSGRWRGDLPDVDTGIYTLRVDEVDTAGTVTSRVETPFKRESPEVLAAVTDSDDGPAKAITVQAGATLWAIARDRYGDGTLYVRVVKANASAIKDANLIYPGQVFDLPE